MRVILCFFLSLAFVCSSYCQTISPVGPLDLCPGGNQLLSVIGAAPTSYQWFQGATAVGAGSTYSVIAAGSYSLVINGGGPGDTLGPVIVTARPNPVAAFSFNPNNQCGNVPVSFINTSTGTGLSYVWDFGDPNSLANNTSAAAQPVHRFVGNPGNGIQSFTVTLTVTSAFGCTATITQTVTINQVPDLTLGGPGATIYNNKKYFRKCSNASTAQFDFTNQSTTIATNTFYQIVFGDATPNYTSATFLTPVAHNYSVGTYSLLFIVTGQNGCKDTSTYYVFVGSNPAVGLGNPGNTAICTSSTLTFPISSTATNPPGTIYTVTFNDGTPPITFPHPAPADISHNFIITSCGTNSPPYPNSFSGTIQASNPCASSTATVVPIYVSQRPVASFTIAPKDTVCVNALTTFTNTSGASNDIDNGTCVPAKFVWVVTPATGWTIGGGALGNDFGLLDPTTWLTGTTNLSLNFTTPGTYSIKLKLGNLTCGADSITKTICVNPLPTGSFLVNQNIGCAPLAVNTTTTANTPLCGTNTYNWTVTYASTIGCAPSTIGYVYLNGTNANSAQPQFQFNNPGVYTIGLVVVGPATSCSSAIVTQTITVKGKPVVTLGALPATLCQNQSISPSATVSCYTSANIYSWSFPGGSPATSGSANPGTITYNTPGPYTISLSVTNECGTPTVTTPIMINVTPVPVVPSNIVVCAGATVGPLTFTSVTGGAAFSWTNNNTSIGLAGSGTSNPIPSFISINAGASPVVATINVTAALNGCSSSNSFTITVNPKPAPPVTVLPLNYCQNAVAVPLTAAASPGNTLLWYTVATGGIGNATAPTPLTTTVGSTTYYVSQSITATGCEGPRTAITVIINPAQSISSASSANPATCSSLTGSITLNGLTPSTIYSVSYTFNGGGTITVNLTSSAAGVIIISGLGAGLYEHIKVILAGCPSNEVGPFNLVDPSAPAMPLIITNSPICAGNTLTLSASTTSPGVATFTWTGPNGFTSALPNPTIPNATVAASGTYNVTATISGCTSPVGSVAIVVNATPATPVAGSNSPLCGGVGLSLNLTSSTTFPGAVSYSWTGPNSFTSSLQNPVITSVTGIHAGTYTVIATATAGSCPSAPASTVVVVNPTPTISSSSAVNPSSCGSATGSITLNGLQPNIAYIVNYLFNSSPQTSTITSGPTGILIIPGLVQGAYTNVTVVLGGCPSSAVGPFNLADPNPPVTPVASSNSPLCSGATLNLQSNATAGASYLWTGPNGFTAATQNPSIANVATAASGIYSVTVTVSNCTSAAGNVSVLVNQTPATPTVGSNSPLCSNVGATLNLTSSTTTAGTITYSWTGPNGFISPAQNPSIPNITIAMAGTYNVTATNSLGTCPSAITGIPVVVNPTPVITGSSHIDPTNCGSSTGFISLTGLTPNTSYLVNYLQSGNPQSATILSNGAGVVTITALPQGTYTNIFVVLTGCPSAPVGPIVLTDPNPPAAPSASSNAPICSGTTLNLNASTAAMGTISYSWTGPNGFISNIQNPSIANVTTAASGTYNVILTVNNCVSSASPLVVLINPLPLAPVVGSPVNYCIGNTASALTATALPGHTLLWYNVATGGTSSTVAPVPLTTVVGNTNYYVSQVNTATSCEGARALINVIINPDAIADFRPTDTIGCPPFNITSAIINLQTYPANNGIYQWYVNNVLIGTGTVFPGYTILNEDDFVTIKLKVISPFGCKSDSISHNFYTYKLPHPSFTLSDTLGCGPISVLITNTTPNIGLFTYTWNFGNGQTSSAAQPGTIVFPPNPNSGDTTYVISLSIFSICDTITVTDSVRVKAKPKALFTPSRTVGCSPMTVTFTNNSLGINNTYFWDFGDGTTTTTNNNNSVVHTYNTGIQDTFYIRLIAVNECGADTITYSVIAAPNNIHLNLAVNGTNYFGCEPHTVAFINNTPGASSFDWNFGDGNTLNTTAIFDTVYHTYLSAGTFTVTLTAQNSCTDTSATLTITVFPKPHAAFIADRYTACIGEPIHFTNLSSAATSYLWQFGDGGTSTLLDPTHAYAAPGLYNVMLIVYRVNAPGNICVDTTVQQVQIVGTQPGSFTMSGNSSLCAPFTVTFVNQNRPSVSSNWDFGDGNTATGDSVVHTFLTAGIFIVKLTVTVPGGCTFITQNTVTVSGPSGSLLYTGGFKCYPDPVRLEAVAVNTNTLLWDFGDGTTLSTTQLVIFHNYTNPGLYVPTLTLQNTAGCNYFIQGLDTIKVDKIDAGYNYATQHYCGSTELAFADTSHVFFGTSLVKWDFGDGNTGAGVNINHTYSTTGLYAVQMIVIGNSGCSDTVTKQLNVFVNSKPVASISADTLACTNQPVLFSGIVQSTDPLNIYQWTISNGVNAAGQNLSYSFPLPGLFSVTFITGTVNGCYDTSYHIIRVNPSPVVTASASVTFCLGNSAQLTVTGAPQYQWSPIQGLSCTTCANPVASPVITTPYIVTGTNSFGCSGYDTVVVTVIQPLNMTVSPNDTICIGKSANLIASGATSYVWSPAQGLNSTTISNPTASPVVTTIYRVVGYDGFNCFTDTAFIVVAVGNYPIVSLGPDKVLATGTILPLVTTIQNGPIRYWDWLPPNDLSCADCPLPNATIKNDISYIVNVTNIYGCKGSDTMKIRVFCTDSQVFIPNAFSPDNDGINDILMVMGKGIVTVKSFRIFNRWGEVVFERNNFPPNNPAYGWNGKIKGVAGPSDVFVYTAEVICDNGTAYTFKGNVSIIK